MALLTQALITVADARVYPGMPATGCDDIIESLINGATEDFEDYCQTAFIQRTFTQDYTWNDIRQGDPSKLYLRRYPVVSVTSITDPAGNTVGSTLYWIEKNKGILHHIGNWGIPVDSNGNATYWTVVYVAGWFSTRAAVKSNVIQAVKMEVAYRLRRPDTSVMSKSVGDLSISYSSRGGQQQEEEFGLLPEARRKLSAYLSVSI